MLASGANDIACITEGKASCPVISGKAELIKQYTANFIPALSDILNLLTYKVLRV
jgi:hypothetical protein